MNTIYKNIIYFLLWWWIILAKGKLKLEQLEKSILRFFGIIVKQFGNLQSTSSNEFKRLEVKIENLTSSCASEFKKLEMKIENLTSSCANEFKRLENKIESLQSCFAIELEKTSAQIKLQESLFNQNSEFETPASRILEKLDDLENIIVSKISPAVLKDLVILKNSTEELKSLTLIEFNNLSKKIDVQKYQLEMIEEANKLQMESFQKILIPIQTNVNDLKFAAGIWDKIYFEDNFKSNPNLKWKDPEFINKLFNESNTENTIDGYAKIQQTLISYETIVVQLTADLKGAEDCGVIRIALSGCNFYNTFNYPSLQFFKSFGKSTCGLIKYGALYWPDKETKPIHSEPDMDPYVWETGMLTVTFILTPNNIFTVKVDNKIIYNGTMSKVPQPNFEVCHFNLTVYGKQYSIELIDVVFTNSEIEAEQRYQQINSRKNKI